MNKKILSFLLVFIQFSAIWFLAVYSGIWDNAISTTLGSSGIIIGVWAIYIMKFKVNIFPDVIKDRPLYTNGLYAFIRHPMYLSVLLVCLAWVIQRFDTLSTLVWLVLYINLLVKLHYEESMLLNTFREYKEYQKKTKKLIPFIY